MRQPAGQIVQIAYSVDCQRNLLRNMIFGVMGIAALMLFGSGISHAGDRSAYAKAKPGELVETFYLSGTKDFIALTHSGQSFMRVIPEGIPLLSEPNLNGAFALIMKVRDASGTVIGFATELETYHEERTDEDLNIMNTDWIVVIPGRGTLYLYELEDNRDLIIDIARPVLAGAEDWRGNHEMISTIGPRPDGRGVINGGTGDFEGLAGSFVEIHHITEFRADHHLESAAELRLFKLPADRP